MLHTPSQPVPSNHPISPGVEREDISFVNPLEESQWDSAIQGLPEVSFFHSAAWCRVLALTYGYRPLYVIGTRSGGLRSVLPILEVRSRLTGSRGVGLPFTDYCPPLGSDSDAIRGLFSVAAQYGCTHDWKYLELAGGRRFFPTAPASTSYLGHQLDLTSNEASLFGRLNSSCRQALRKAVNNGVEVEFRHDRAAIRIFYNLHCLTRRRHGLPPQPFRFFANIHRQICAAGRGIVVLAKWQGRMVAGAVFFHFGKQVIYKFGASDFGFQHLRANNLVMWEAIKYFSCRGEQSMHLGRTSVEDQGLRAYKLGWGSREHAIDYVRYAPATDRFVGGKDRSSGWHTQLFRCLPMWCSRLAGSALYQHIG